MNWHFKLPFLALVTLAGCSAQTNAPAHDDLHPASPAAAATPETPRSTTLRSTPAPVEAAVADTAAGHDHSSHGSQAAVPATAPSTAGGQLYICPMHPKVVSADPKAPCPECGMKINKPKPATGAAAPADQAAAHDHASHAEHAATPATAPSTTTAGQQYICPMHPEVVSYDSNARCPKCGMKINKPNPTTTPGAATSPAAPAHQHGGH